MVTVMEMAPGGLGLGGLEALGVEGVEYLRASSSTLGIRSPMRKGFDTTSSWNMLVFVFTFGSTEKPGPCLPFLQPAVWRSARFLHWLSRR